MYSHRILLPLAHFLLFLLFSSAAIHTPTREEELPSDQWYTKYESYPEYCSTPKQLQQRSIPPLHPQQQNDNTNHNSPQSQIFQTKILHVTAVIRHGARTPSKPHTCWDGFWSSNSDTAIWNCELTTMIAPPSSHAIRQCKLHPSQCNTNTNYDGDGNVIHSQEIDGEGAMFLFDKQYDAFQNNSPSSQLKNQLNGTCQVGQLLLRGYEQELHNGRMLRKTYVKEDGTKNKIMEDEGEDEEEDDSDDHDSIDDSMVLFNLTDESYIQSGNRPYEEPHLYYRADDDQRTLMSGQVLLRGLFGDLLLQHSEQLGVHSDPTIVLHTADRSQDILSRNSDVCPRLDEIQQNVIDSQEYKDAFENSKEGQILNSLMENELGGNFQHSAQDCLMSTICTDRQLPTILDDYGKNNNKGTMANKNRTKYGTGLFDRLRKYSYLPKNFVLVHNDCEYAKLASGPLWVEILSNLLSFLPISSSPSEPLIQIPNHLKSKLRNPPPKLSLFSAHDGTLHMLLASLGKDVFFDGKEWAPFASYFVIELHDIHVVQIDVTEDEEKKVQELFPSRKAFRLIFNGIVLTSKIKGCQVTSEAESITSDLCDVSHLIHLVEPFAVTDRSCEKIYDGTDTEEEDGKDTNSDTISNTATKTAASTTSSSDGATLTSANIFSTSKSVAMVVLIALFSGILGSVFTFLYLNRQHIFYNPRTRNKRGKYESFDEKDENDYSTHIIESESKLPDLT